MTIAEALFILKTPQAKPMSKEALARYKAALDVVANSALKGV